MMHREHTYLECRCDSPEHIVRWTLDTHPNYEPDLYVDVSLAQWNGFFKRCWLALRYIFGCTQRFGHYDVTMIRIEDVPAMRAALDDFEAAYVAYGDALATRKENKC